MVLALLYSSRTVCRIESVDTDEFVFLSKTDDEISLVCKSNVVPSNVITSETGWKALKICGILDFGMIGVISKISAILAEAGIGIFVVSTFNTDYIFLKEENYIKGIELLSLNGYVVKEV